MNESFDISTVIFAVLAVFVVWKLRSVLGTRTGTERPPYDPFEARRKARNGAPTGPVAPPGPAPNGEESAKVIRMPGKGGEKVAAPQAPDITADWAPHLEAGSRAAEGIARIAKLDPNFTADHFMSGARAAYEIIVTSFAAGNRDALAPLLAKDVLEGFASAIADREARGEKVETTFVSMEKSTVEEAQLRDRSAQVTIRFQSKMITVTRNREGQPIEGKADQTVDVVDIWTFAREVDSRNPNWRLVATEGGA